MGAKTKCILCPVDFSEHSRRALSRATEVAELLRAKLYIVHVEASPSVLPDAVTYEAELDQHRRLLDEIPDSKKLRYEHHCLQGDAATEILRFAMVRKVDRIIMGTHGRTGLMATLMGSVADAVCRRAICEVETVTSKGKAGTWLRATE